MRRKNIEVRDDDAPFTVEKCFFSYSDIMLHAIIALRMLVLCLVYNVMVVRGDATVEDVTTSHVILSSKHCIAVDRAPSRRVQNTR